MSQAEVAAVAKARLANGDAQGALRCLADALRRNPDQAALWLTLGKVYLALPRPADALVCFERALALQPGDPEALHESAAAWLAQGRPEQAIAIYRRALAERPEQTALRLGLAAALVQAGQARSAAAEAESLTKQNPGSAAAWRVRGDAAMALQQPESAASAYRKAADLEAGRADAHYCLGLALQAAGQAEAAAAAFAQAVAADPEHAFALAQLCHLKRRLCDWSGLDALTGRLREAVRGGRPGITPFSFLAESGDPAEQLACARQWGEQVQREAAALAPQMTAPLVQRTGAAPIRAGFVSSGFGNHPTALLIAELIEHLRGSGLTTLGFATSADDGGAMRQRLRRAFHHFEEVSGLGPLALAARLRQAELDIVFDLRGYGEGAVSPVYALRVAPVQVNWLAYPSTQGAAFVDYLLADRFVVPAAERAHYSEAVVRLPHCFQPSDSTRAIPEAPSRAECGLPEHGPVLASFNNSYKIGPAVFEAWAAILNEVPQAVLWLLIAGPAPMQDNLRREAAARGIDPQRLRFMPKLPHPEYLARYRHIDLFLDTWPYNAHTTASDALWAGCPVLTLPGRSFAARVAGSLLTTLRLPQLIAADADDYVGRAVALAGDPTALARLREELAAAKKTSPLFDMRGFAAGFAEAVRWMAARERSGLPPIDHDIEPRP